MSGLGISKEMELRHLPINHRLQLIKLLDVDESILNLLMANIVKINSQETEVQELRFNSADIDAIREQSQRLKQSAIHILLDEWGTMGKTRPKIKDLLKLLIQCQLFQAADFVADLINEEKAIRPTVGPAASVNISLEDENIEDIVNRLNYPFSSIDLTTKANRINFVKPEINTPNLRDFMNNDSKISDMIKFSKSSIVAGTVIPNNGNGSNIEQFDVLPALSGLMLSDEASLSTNQLPVFVNSIEAESNGNSMPDFSGLMNNNNDVSETISEDQSFTESTMSFS